MMITEKVTYFVSSDGTRHQTKEEMICTEFVLEMEKIFPYDSSKDFVPDFRFIYKNLDLFNQRIENIKKQADQLKDS